MPDVELFPDAEARENPPEQIVRVKLAGNLVERPLRKAQLFRDELACAALLELARRFEKVRSRGAQRIEVTTARRDGAGFHALITDALLQVLTQVPQAESRAR